ncbi:MAG: hypothetical protein ACPIOQ_07110 [Promethearchaeia archaeon]
MGPPLLLEPWETAAEARTDQAGGYGTRAACKVLKACMPATSMARHDRRRAVRHRGAQ